MTAAWHVGPIAGFDFWWLLVSSPEILVFLFFMITDPKTIPASRTGRRVYAIGVGLLATVLIAPFTTEFATKVAILGSLFAVCALKGALALVGSDRLSGIGTWQPRRRLVGTVAFAGALAYAGLVVAAGIPARPETITGTETGGPLPEIVVTKGDEVASIDRATAETIARSIVADLRTESAALRKRDQKLATSAASGPWLATLWSQVRGPSRP